MLGIEGFNWKVFKSWPTLVRRIVLAWYVVAWPSNNSLGCSSAPQFVNLPLMVWSVPLTLDIADTIWPALVVFYGWWGWGQLSQECWCYWWYLCCLQSQIELYLVEWEWWRWWSTCSSDPGPPHTIWLQHVVALAYNRPPDPHHLDSATICMGSVTVHTA